MSRSFMRSSRFEDVEEAEEEERRGSSIVVVVVVVVVEFVVGSWIGEHIMARTESSNPGEESMLSL